MGFSEEEILSEGFSMWEMFTPESKQLVKQRKEALQNNIDVPGIYELQIITSGQLRDIEFSTTPLSGWEKIV